MVNWFNEEATSANVALSVIDIEVKKWWKNKVWLVEAMKLKGAMRGWHLSRTFYSLTHGTSTKLIGRRNCRDGMSGTGEHPGLIKPKEPPCLRPGDVGIGMSLSFSSKL